MKVSNYKLCIMAEMKNRKLEQIQGNGAEIAIQRGFNFRN